MKVYGNFAIRKALRRRLLSAQADETAADAPVSPLRSFAMFEFGRSDDERSLAALVRPTPVRSSGERMMPYRRVPAFSDRGNPAVQSKNIRCFSEGVSSVWLRRCEGNEGQPRIVHDKAT
jgi:hypothetical protein